MTTLSYNRQIRLTTRRMTISVQHHPEDCNSDASRVPHCQSGYSGDRSFLTLNSIVCADNASESDTAFQMTTPFRMMTLQANADMPADMPADTYFPSER